MHSNKHIVRCEWDNHGFTNTGGNGTTHTATRCADVHAWSCTYSGKVMQHRLAPDIHCGNVGDAMVKQQPETCPAIYEHGLQAKRAIHRISTVYLTFISFHFIQ